MRFLSVLIGMAFVLTSLPMSQAFSDNDADGCLEARGKTRNPRLHNQCSYDINAVVCCYGQGSLGSCQGNGFLHILIEGDSAVSIPSCDKDGVADACKAPYEFESLHWDSATGSVVAGPCVDKSALSSIEQEQQAYLVEGTIQIERVDERGADLSGAQMSNEDLTDANFSGADMENANLDGAKLFMADLTDTNLRGASLQNSILEFAKLGGANLTNANLTGADLDGARLRGTIFCNTIMPDGVVNNDGCS